MVAYLSMEGKLEERRVTVDEFMREAERQDVPIKYRALRKYIQLGIIPYPENRGQHVGYYDISHIARIKAVKQLMRLFNFQLVNIAKIVNRGVELEDVVHELADEPKNIREKARILLENGWDLVDIKKLFRFGSDVSLDRRDRLEAEFPKAKYKLLMLRGEIESLILKEKAKMEDSQRKVNELKGFLANMDAVEKKGG